MRARPKARLVDGEVVIAPMTTRQQAEALMDPEIFRAVSIFVTLSPEDKDRTLAECRRLLREQLEEEAAQC